MNTLNNQLSKEVVYKWAAVFAPVSHNLALTLAKMGPEYERLVMGITLINMQQFHDHSGCATMIMSDAVTLRLTREGNGVVMLSSLYPDQPQRLNYPSVTAAVMEIGSAFIAAGFDWEFGPDTPNPSLMTMAEAVGRAIADYSGSLTFVSCDEPDDRLNVGFNFTLNEWPVPFSLSAYSIRTAYFGPSYD